MPLLYDKSTLASASAIQKHLPLAQLGLKTLKAKTLLKAAHLEHTIPSQHSDPYIVTDAHTFAISRSSVDLNREVNTDME